VPAEYPRWNLSEVAVIGRSNAGKSSLINTLAGRHDLARVSKTPGRTQRAHFFAEHRLGLALVDLPGYGFAHASKQARAEIAKVAERYLLERDRLRGLVVLLDVRREPEEDERFLVELAASRDVEVIRVATKIDKLGRAERVRRLRELEKAGMGGWLPFSAISREGRQAIIAAMIAAAH